MKNQTKRMLRQFDATSLIKNERIQSLNMKKQMNKNIIETQSKDLDVIETVEAEILEGEM